MASNYLLNGRVAYERNSFGVFSAHNRVADFAVKCCGVSQ